MHRDVLRLCDCFRLSFLSTTKAGQKVREKFSLGLRGDSAGLELLLDLDL